MILFSQAAQCICGVVVKTTVLMSLAKSRRNLQTCIQIQSLVKQRDIEGLCSHHSSKPPPASSHCWKAENQQKSESLE